MLKESYWVVIVKPHIKLWLVLEGQAGHQDGQHGGEAPHLVGDAGPGLLVQEAVQRVAHPRGVARRVGPRFGEELQRDCEHGTDLRRVWTRDKRLVYEAHHRDNQEPSLQGEERGENKTI